jgi:hypothetical protein
MSPTNIDITKRVILETKYIPEKYVCCVCCCAILGYKAYVNGVLNLFVYRMPLQSVRCGMAKRETAVRIRSGQVLCSLCNTLQPWYIATQRETPEN